MNKSAIIQDYFDILNREGYEPYMSFSDNKEADAVFERIKNRKIEASNTDGIEANMQKEQWKVFRDAMKPENMLFQHALDIYSKRIESVIETTMGLSIPGSIYVGEYPTGSFNALACQSQHGSLILVNTGAFILISKLYRLMIINIYQQYIIPNESSYNLDDNEKKLLGSGESLLSPSDIITAIAVCVFEYVLSGSSLKLPKLPILSNLQQASFTNLLVNTELFLIAHEYGHALAGHLTPARTQLFARDIGSFHVYKKAWEDEFEADKIASQIMLNYARTSATKNEEIAVHEHFSVTGILLFFELDKIITDIAIALVPEYEEKLWISHPPPSQRSERVCDFLRNEGAKEAIDQAQDFISWTRGVAKWTSLLAEEAHDRFTKECDMNNDLDLISVVTEVIKDLIYGLGTNGKRKNR